MNEVENLIKPRGLFAHSKVVLPGQSLQQAVDALVRPQVHVHHYQVTTTERTAVKYCTECGKSWFLADILSNHRYWQLIKEEA